MNQNNLKAIKAVKRFKPAARQNDDKSYRPILIGLKEDFIANTPDLRNALNTNFDNAVDAIKFARNIQQDIIASLSKTPELEEEKVQDDIR